MSNMAGLTSQLITNAQGQVSTTFKCIYSFNRHIFPKGKSSHTMFKYQSHYFHTCVSGNWNTSPAGQPCITGWSCGSLCVTCSRPAGPDCVPTATHQLPGPDHCYDRKRSNSCCPVRCLCLPQSHFAPDTHQDQHRYWNGTHCGSSLVCKHTINILCSLCTIFVLF